MFFGLETTLVSRPRDVAVMGVVCYTDGSGFDLGISGISDKRNKCKIVHFSKGVTVTAY